MGTNWLWDKDITEEESKAILVNSGDPQFIAYAALLLSRTNSAKEVFQNFLSRENFFVSWTKIKRQMRKDSWNNPKIDYWQAIYDTLKAEKPELKQLKAPPSEPSVLKESVSSVTREIGARIKALREQGGLSQKDLAGKLGISAQIISRIESGRQNVSVETLNKICEKLGVHIDAVFRSQPEESQKTIAFREKSPEEFVKVVYEILERSKTEYCEVQHYDGPGDKGRDIVAYKYAVGGKEQWYFQCKRYAVIGFPTFKAEIDKIIQHSQKDDNFRPHGIVFVTACKVSPRCKDDTKTYASKSGLNKVIFWTDVELAAKAKAAGIHDELSPMTIQDLKENAENIKKHLTREIAQLLVSRDDTLSNTMYWGEENFEKTQELAGQARNLAPKAPQNLMLAARVLMQQAQARDVIQSVFDVIPGFKDYENIHKAKNFLNEALEILKRDGNARLENQIKYDLSICALWLRHLDEFKVIRDSIDSSKLGHIEQSQLNINDALVGIQKRNFEVACSKLKDSGDWQQLPYKEKARIAHILFLKGAPRESKDIFSSIEQEAQQKKDMFFYIDMSLNEALLCNKHLAIKYAEKAKEFATDPSKEKIAFPHYNAVMMRYARDNEVDRLMSGLFDYDAKFPEHKVIRSIKAIEDDGSISKEFESMLLEKKKRYEGIKQTFREQPIPSYVLEKILKRTYVEILSFRSWDELDFRIELTLPEKSFEDSLINNFEKGKNLVFDYASLLNLSKMNLLGFLEKLGKEVYISEKLFDKIQYELLHVEQEDLRSLWRFLKDSKVIHIADRAVSSTGDKKYAALFDEWLVESLDLAKNLKAVFVVDDLRLLKFFQREEGIQGCNSFILLKSLLTRGWIDAKMYATSLGDLAERFYTFLPFSGEDLFHIVMEDQTLIGDKSKISLRSYHLVDEMFLPGSVVPSFTAVFVKFIDLLWKTGSLPGYKVQWLFFLTNKITNFVEQRISDDSKQDLEQISPNFVQMWVIAVQNSSRDEILLLEKQLDEILKAEVYYKFKDRIMSFMMLKKAALFGTPL